MSLRTSLLPVLERLRGTIPVQLGLRPYSVTVRVRTWTGQRPGMGTHSDVDTVLGNAGQNVKVTLISSRDIVASGGRYTAGDFRVGPLTPSHATGGTPLSVFDPPRSATAREIFFIVTGPGLPDEGAVCKRVDANPYGLFRSEIVVRRTGERP